MISALWTRHGKVRVALSVIKDCLTRLGNARHSSVPPCRPHLDDIPHETNPKHVPCALWRRHEFLVHQVDRRFQRNPAPAGAYTTSSSPNSPIPLMTRSRGIGSLTPGRISATTSRMKESLPRPGSTVLDRGHRLHHSRVIGSRHPRSGNDERRNFHRSPSPAHCPQARQTHQPHRRRPRSQPQFKTLPCPCPWGRDTIRVISRHLRGLFLLSDRSVFP